MYTLELIQLHVDDMRKMAARTRVHEALPASARLRALVTGVLSGR